MWMYISLSLAVLALISAFIIGLSLKRKICPNKEAEKISFFIRQGGLTFLAQEYKILAIFAILTAILLSLFLSFKLALAFIIGAFFSALAGNIGLRVATSNNAKTAFYAEKNFADGLKIAFFSGSVTGLSVVGLGLLGVVGLYLIFKDPQLIYGFCFGASSVALFARVGGGIYTKAADVGADLVGKIEKGIPEDDPRNPAVIADNVGDNVGDVHGMGADLFESYVGSLVAAMVLGLTVVGLDQKTAVSLPLLLAGLGILASLAGNLIIYLTKRGQPMKILNSGIWLASLLMVVSSFLISLLIFKNLNIFITILVGLLSGLIIGLTAEYYTSSGYKPTQEIAKLSQTGASTNLIAGLSSGMRSNLIPVLSIGAVILLSHKLMGLYGIGLASVGMLSTLAITLAADTYGPVADNAAGISEMAKMGETARKNSEKLDAVGNTTAAIGKGFAIGSAGLTALVFSVGFSQIAKIKILDLNEPRVIVGLFLGGLLPFLFSSFSLRSVGKAASKIIDEVRRQFKEIKGLAEGEVLPDYKSCIAIASHSALKEMIAPGLLAIVSPILVGFILGKEALGGLLWGAIVTGFLLAIMMANSGGSWDNAKKYIEEGNFGGKGSFSHQSAVIGDTVGDPFKDTAGPSLNILIKLMSIIALIIAPLL